MDYSFKNCKLIKVPDHHKRHENNIDLNPFNLQLEKLIDYFQRGVILDLNLRLLLSSTH